MLVAVLSVSFACMPMGTRWHADVAYAQGVPLASISNEELGKRLTDALKQNDYVTAFPNIKVLAERGEARSQTLMGLFFAGGLAVKMDERQAVFWFQKAADQGSPKAQARLGVAYRDGYGGLPVDYTRAVDLLNKAAAQNEAEAMASLGDMYERGKGVPLDYSKAMEWYSKAADRNTFAQLGIGRLYLNGRGVRKDSAKAAEWLHKAAENGMAGAQTTLAGMSMEGVGVPKDLTEAANWLRKAADQGDDYGEYALGLMYHEGMGVKRDLAMARGLFKKAADQGNQKAKDSLARMDAPVTADSLRGKLPPAIEFRCVFQGGVPAARAGNDAGVDAAYVACTRKEWKRLFGSTPFPGDP